MSWFASLLSKLLPGLVVDATTRLVQAARESLRPKPASGDVPPPPPPIGESGARQASEYLRGYADAKWKQHMDERNAGAAERLARAAEDDPVEPEKPSDGEGER
jgi:hypothetical protein